MSTIRIFARIDIDDNELQNFADNRYDIVNRKEEYIDNNLYDILNDCNYNYTIIDVCTKED